jgi:hypothetical protein
MIALFAGGCSYSSAIWPNRAGPRGADGLCRWLGGQAIALRPKPALLANSSKQEEQHRKSKKKLAYLFGLPLAKIQTGTSGWEKMVSERAAAIIKERHLFGYKMPDVVVEAL